MTAQGVRIPVVSPGRWGVNREGKGSLMSMDFAIRAENAVVDGENRLAARKGYTDNTTTKITSTPLVQSLFEYIQQDNTVMIISAYGGAQGGISDDIADPEANEVHGSFTVTDGVWWFQNFNDNVLCFQQGQRFGVKSGTGNFVEVVEGSGTAPVGGVALCAFGRVWMTGTDGSTIEWSGLLDEKDWGGATAGSIDMANVWTHGTDEITAISSFEGSLVVFGRDHIVFLTDGKGNALGFDPDDMYVADVIQGTGCVSQWTIATVGTSDVIFLSPNGVQSLARLHAGVSDDKNTLTQQVRTELRETYDAETENLIRGMYSEKEGYYLLSFPSRNKTYCIDLSSLYQDEDARGPLPVITEWDLAPDSMVSRRNGDVMYGLTGELGTADTYGDDGVAYTFRYESPWTALTQEIAGQQKLVKRIKAIVYSPGAVITNITLYTDFNLGYSTVFSNVLPADAAAEWNLAEWGLSEISGGATLRAVQVPARAVGQYVKIAVDASVTNVFALQEVDFFVKVGRTA